MITMKNGQSLIYYLRDKFDAIFHNFWHKLNRSIDWFFFMWTNEEWDSHYLYKVMDKKMESMKIYLKTKGVCVSNKQDAKIINIAQWYLQRLINDDICDNLHNQFYAKYGYQKMIDKPNTEHSTIGPSICYVEFVLENKYVNKDYYDKLLMRICRINGYLYKKYTDRFYYIMKKHSYEWGD